MKKILTSLALVVAATSSFGFQYPMHSNYIVTVNNTAFGSSLTSMEQFVTIKNEPTTRLNNSWMGYYAMSSFMYSAGTQGYMGLQKDYYGKKIIFSTWDPPASTGLMVRTTNPNCTRFGHEGSGVMCVSEYDWKPGIEYKFILTRERETSYGDMYSVHVINMQNNDDYIVGEIEMPNYNPGLQYGGPAFVGYGGISLAGTTNVLEYYTGPSNLTCNSLPYFAAEWKGPFGDNGTVFPTVSQAVTTTNLPEQCPTKTSATPLDEPYTVLQETGGNIVSNMQQSAMILSFEKTVPFNEIDCLLNKAEILYPNLFDQSKFSQKRMSNMSADNHYYGRDYRVNNKGAKLVADLKTNTLNLVEGGIAPIVAILNDSTKKYYGCKF